MADRRARPERRAPTRLPDDKIPHSIEAEKAVLGTLMVRPELIHLLPPELGPQSFYRYAHQLVFCVLLDLAARKVPADTLTVVEELRRLNQLDEVGGPAYVASLPDGVPRSTNVGAYADTVVEHAVRRAVIALADQLLTDAPTATARDLLAQAQRGVIDLQARDLRETGAVAAKALVEATFAALERLQAGGVSGVPTGFTDLDVDLSGGLQEKDLVLVAARPSVGKTAFAMNVARHVAATGTVLVFSLEMAKEQLMQRLLCAEARVDGARLRTGHLSEADYARISAALATLAELRLHIDDTPGLPVEDMLVRARRAKIEHGELVLVVVDYLQLMGSRERHENRQQQVSYVSRTLKAAAKELGCPVLALSQLSRAPEQRGDKRPQLSDLRESGALEQDADVVLGLYRPDDDDRTQEGLCEVLILKQRNGPCTIVRLVYLRELTKFENMTSAQG